MSDQQLWYRRHMGNSLRANFINSVYRFLWSGYKRHNFALPGEKDQDRIDWEIWKANVQAHRSLSISSKDNDLVLTMFHDIFDTVPERPVGNSDNHYFVLDGGSLIHRVIWPKRETFGDVYTTYMSYIKRKVPGEIIFNESTVLLDSQRQFLSNLANKERFISQTL
ncbi:hypothetical protein AVEN_240372-1 [Araneus ventricosus]|uniref:Uncharacterized protein n=1 Tax=Araneus ventricosus TaxID=182803 RepID=A0A4Y2F4I1_ARAVE|nr:hypothetical protein AVEN_240372-1 [Araneus ventricosus]